VAGSFAPLGIGYVILDRNLSLGQYYLLLSGLSLILTAIFNPQGIAGRTRENNAIIKAKLAARRARRQAEVSGPAPPTAEERLTTEAARVG
jgi:branched-chain amino acid transport system permease protein